MRSPRGIRIAMGFLFAVAATIGALGTLAPRTFFDDFPFFAHWVDLLPPYNQHLVTDVGGLYLGFAVLFGLAAWRLEVNLVRAVAAAWLLIASLHFVFHAERLEGFSTADAIAQMISLGLMVAAPLLALWGAAGERFRSSDE